MMSPQLSLVLRTLGAFTPHATRFIEDLLCARTPFPGVEVQGQVQQTARGQCCTGDTCAGSLARGPCMPLLQADTEQPH